MLAVFLSNEKLLGQFSVSFSYRKGDEYEKGMKKRVPSLEKFTQFPLVLICEHEFISTISRKFPKLIALAFKALYLVVPIKYVLFLTNFIQMWRLFGSHKVDLVHINNGGYPAAMSASAAAIAARLRGIKRIVYVVNNVATPYSKPLRWYDYPVDLIVKRCVSVFVTGSEFAGKALKSVLGESQTRWVKIHNGIKRRAIIESSEEVALRLGLNTDRLRFGVVALFEERKGHIVLLKAVKELVGQDKEVPLILLEGHGVLKQELMQFVDDHSLQEHVLFIGDEANVFDFLNCLDLVILPSIRNEDFPNVILEAMSLGKPVIATRVAGIPEQITTDTGIIVPPGGVKQMADAITFMMENESDRLQFGLNAIKRFDSSFEEGISVDNYLKLYMNLLEGR